MKTISTKLILSFFFLVSLALLISGMVFFTSYTQTLQHSEYEALKRIAADIYDYVKSKNISRPDNAGFYNFLQKVSTFEEVSIRIQNNRNQLIYELVPEFAHWSHEHYPDEFSPDFVDGFSSEFVENGLKLFAGRRYRQIARELEERKRWLEPFLSRRDSLSEALEVYIPAVGTPRNFRNRYLLTIFRPQGISNEFLFAAAGGFVISAIIAITASVLAGIYLGKRITRPIISLKQSALSMAEGNYHVRAQVKTRDETADLAESFNILGSRLEKRIQELSDERDSLRDFLADASHELRTPLTAMLTSSEILGEKLDLSDARLAGLHKQNHQSILRMKALVDHLLSLSRLQGGIQNMNLQACDLSELVQTAIELVNGQCHYDIDPRLPPIRADKLSFIQVFRNCFENSLNAGAGHIRVTAREEGENLVISVVDDGRGIAEKDMDAVSKRFYKGTGSTGTGLGLAIVQSIVSAHGGRMEIFSPPQKSDAPEAEPQQADAQKPALQKPNAPEAEPQKAEKGGGCELRFFIPISAA